MLSILVKMWSNVLLNGECRDRIDIEMLSLCIRPIEAPCLCHNLDCLSYDLDLLMTSLYCSRRPREAYPNLRR